MRHITASRFLTPSDTTCGWLRRPAAAGRCCREPLSARDRGSVSLDARPYTCHLPRSILWPSIAGDESRASRCPPTPRVRGQPGARNPLITAGVACGLRTSPCGHERQACGAGSPPLGEGHFSRLALTPAEAAIRATAQTQPLRQGRMSSEARLSTLTARAVAAAYRPVALKVARRHLGFVTPGAACASEAVTCVAHRDR